MQFRLITGLVLALCLCASTLFSQTDRGQLWEVQSMKIPPSQVFAFEQVAQNIVSLAKEKNVPEKFAWHFWNDGFNYYVASPHANFASFDDPTAWMRAFGEDGGEKLGAIFQKIENDLKVRPQHRELIEEVRMWSYEPATAMQPSAGTLYSFYVKPGHTEKFGAAIQGFISFWKDIDYPYAVMGYRPHLGAINRVQFMIFHDGLANYEGKNSDLVLAEKAGKVDLHQKTLGTFFQHIEDMEVQHMQYKPNLSYTGPTVAASNR